MIPLKDQEIIRQKFGHELSGPVKIDLFIQREVGLEVPGQRPCLTCKPTREMLQELAGLNDLISLRVHILEEAAEERRKFGVERVPATVLRGRDSAFVVFYGLPGGMEFPAFVESIVDVSRQEVDLSKESVRALQGLEGDVSLRVFVTPTCPYCPAMARAAFQMGLVTPRVRAEVIEVNEFPELAEHYGVRAVPLTVINDRLAVPGMVQERVLVEQVIKASQEAAASAEEPPAPIERGKLRQSGLYIP